MHVPILIIVAVASLFFAPWWVAGAIFVGGLVLGELSSIWWHSRPIPKDFKP